MGDGEAEGPIVPGGPSAQTSCWLRWRSSVCLICPVNGGWGLGGLIFLLRLEIDTQEPHGFHFLCCHKGLRKRPLMFWERGDGNFFSFRGEKGGKVVLIAMGAFPRGKKGGS